MSDPAMRPTFWGGMLKILTWRRLSLAVILFLAAFLRLWQLETIPPGLAHDEAYNGLDAIALLEGKDFPIFHEGWELYAEEAHANRPVHRSKYPVFFEGNYGREPALVYLMSVSIWIFGPTALALRIVSAILGLLSVLGTYLVATVLFSFLPSSRDSISKYEQIALSSLVPLISALFMAILFPSILFSRIGIRPITFLPVATFSIYAFWRGIHASGERSYSDRRGNSFQTLPLGNFRPFWFLISGLLLGLSVYTYAAARFLPFLFFIFIPFWYIRDRTIVKRLWANLTIMATSALLVVLPIVIFFYQQPYYLVERSLYLANRSRGTYPGQPLRTWLENMVRVFVGLFYRGDETLVNNLPGRPYLDPFQSLMALVGLVRLIVFRINIRNIFLFLWFLVMLVPGIVSGDAPHFGRLIGIAPPLAIIIASGFVWSSSALMERLSDRLEGDARLIGAGMMALLVFTASFSVWDYFKRYVEDPELPIAYNLADWQLGRYTTTLPEDANVYLTPNQQEMATIYFALEGDRDRLRSYHSPAASLIPVGIPGQDSIYLVRPYAEEVLNQLSSAFPSGVIDTAPKSFYAFWLPADAKGLRDDQQIDQIWDGAIALRDWEAQISGTSITVELTWQALVDISREYTIFVHLLDGQGNVIAQNDRLPDGYPTHDWQPQEIVLDQFVVEIPENIGTGPYILQTGFYHLPTLERLGEPVVLGELSVSR